MQIELPEVPKPVAVYIAAKKVDDLVFCSGQDPLKEGKFVYTGKVDSKRTIEKGYQAARICALNCLAAVKSLVGSLNEIEETITWVCK